MLQLKNSHLLTLANFDPNLSQPETNEIQRRHVTGTARDIVECPWASEMHDLLCQSQYNRNDSRRAKSSMAIEETIAGGIDVPWADVFAAITVFDTSDAKKQFRALADRIDAPMHRDSDCAEEATALNLRSVAVTYSTDLTPFPTRSITRLQGHWLTCRIALSTNLSRKDV